MIDWNDIKYFKSYEFGDYSDKMRPEIVYLLDDFRDYIGKPIVIHSAYRIPPENPSYHSYHWDGLAVDIHVVGMSLMNQFLEATRFPFRGIGVYPHWEHPGLHLDMRPVEKMFARWGRIDIGGKKRYVKLDAEFFRKWVLR